MKETALLAKAWTADARTKPICVHLLLHSFYRINEHLRQFMSRDIQQPSIPNYMSKIMEPQKPSPLSDVAALQKSLSDYKTFLAETLATMKESLAQSVTVSFPHLDAFDGSRPYQAQAWLNNCKRMLKLYKIEQEHWVAPIVVSLKGSASFWYQACELANEGVELTWLEFEKAFEERWYEDDKQKFFRARQLIENWKWNGDYEEFYSTYDQIRALVSKKDYPENLLIEEYEKRLPFHLRQSFSFGANDIPSKRKVVLKYRMSVNATPDSNCDTQ